MKIGGKDLLAEIENSSPKLGIYLRSYILPAIQSRGRAGQVLATPQNAAGNVELQDISKLTASQNPTSAPYVGTNHAGQIVTAPTPSAAITQLTGDVDAGPGSGAQLATVVRVNGAAVPISQAYVGTNSSGQIVAAASPIANIQITVGTLTIAANSSSTVQTAVMAGLLTTSTITMTPNADISAIIGWSPSGGGVYFTAWPTAGQLNYRVCNPTGSSITLGASTTWNVSAH